MSRVPNQRRLFLELIEELRPSWRRDPAQPARLQRWLLAHRAGSRDRRLYRELAYTTWRILPWVESAEPDRLVGIVATCAQVSPATDEFIRTYRLDHLPPECDAAQLLPDWLARECPAALQANQRAALLSRAPLWIRVQTEQTDVLRSDLSAAGWSVTPSEVLNTAWRLEGEGDVTRITAFQRGWFEVQDLGSQLLLKIVAPRCGESWLDACAGAGGKTLQLASAVGSTGRVHAYDIRPTALAELQERVRRAGLNNVTINDGREQQYDGVLVDAPCSGSGTWRRAPHLKWTTTPSDLARAAQRQQDLLRHWAEHVRIGGRLVYATCSLCQSENDGVAAAFLSSTTNFVIEPLVPPSPLRGSPDGISILPADVDSDGFFVTCFRRTR